MLNTFETTKRLGNRAPASNDASLTRLTTHATLEVYPFLADAPHLSSSLPLPKRDDQGYGTRGYPHFPIFTTGLLEPLALSNSDSVPSQTKLLYY